MQKVRLIATAALAALAAASVVDAARATFPGRNGEIAYADSWGSDVEFNIDLYRVCPNGSRERLLVSGNPEAGSVAFSPNGRRLALEWTPAYQGRTRIYVSSADGRRRRPVSRPPGGKADVGPVWSPRGGAIAFTRAARSGRRPAVRIYSRGHGRYLARGSGPDWSVRNRIAFTRGRPFESSAKVAVVSAAGGDVRELAAGWNPKWSPDGRRLLFATSTESGATATATMSADGSGQRVLGLGTPVGWAPDGRHLAFVTPDGAAAVVATSGGAVRRLPRAGGSPVFSPDGKWLAHSRGSDLYVTHVDGRRTEYVTTARSLEDLSVVDWGTRPISGHCG